MHVTLFLTCVLLFLTHLPEFQRERFVWTCWSLWNRRNAVVHGNYVKPDIQVLNSISELHIEFKEASQQAVSSGPCSRATRWLLPQGDNLEINVDAAVKSDAGIIGIGVVVCNASGDLLGSLAKPLMATWSPQTAELIAVRDAIWFCVEAGFFQGDIVSDCLTVVML